jgi:hypothetical protein
MILFHSWTAQIVVPSWLGGFWAKSTVIPDTLAYGQAHIITTGQVTNHTKGYGIEMKSNDECEKKYIQYYNLAIVPYLNLSIKLPSQCPVP